MMGAPVSQSVKHWPTDTGAWVQAPLQAEIFPTMNKVPLPFYYLTSKHCPDMTEILLKRK